MPSHGTTTQRGYGWKHQTQRRKWEPIVRSGNATCRRCGQPIQPNAPWDLGHDDHDRTSATAPEHRGRECPMGGNRATASRQHPTKPDHKANALTFFDSPGETDTIGA